MKPDPAPKQSSKKHQASKGTVFDIRRPGRAPASPTSRPVISGHKPLVQDTFSGTGGIGEARPLLNPKQSVTIQPAASEEKIEQSSPPIAHEASNTPPAQADITADVSGTPDNSPTAEAARPASEPISTPLSPPARAVDESASVPDTVAGTAAPTIDRGEVIVSRLSNSTSLLKLSLIILVIIAVGVVALDIMLDAGLFNFSGVPHTHFFS